MSHTTNKIYVDTSTNPDTGISIEDIRSVLHINMSDIGGLITVGATNGIIKKWAKFKPYRSNSLSTSLNNRIAAHYGLSISEFTELGTPGNQSSFLGKLVAGELAWDYLHPRGAGQSPSEWFRFPDFDGYINDAICPIGEPVATVFVQTNGTAQIAWDLLDNLDAGNLTLSDIVINNTPLTNYYLGVLLYKANNNYRLVTSDSLIGAGDVQITISNFPASDLGDWRAYPFFSSVPIAYNGQTGTGSYVSAGWDNDYVELHFRSSSQTLSFYAFGVWRDNTHTIIDVDWYAYNDISTSRTVSPTLVLVYAAEGVQPSAGDMAAQVNLGSITVPGASGGVPGEAHGTTTIVRPSQISYSSYIWWLGIAVQGFQTIYEQIEENQQLEP